MMYRQPELIGLASFCAMGYRLGLKYVRLAFL